jgi:superfamily I DNA/RNA helicase/RecB family exonuclease
MPIEQPRVALARGTGTARPGSVGATALDADQRAVVEAAASARGPHLVVLGAPGTGKTTTALEAVLAAGDAGLAATEVLLLAPTRRQASDLQGRLAQLWRRPEGVPAARTPAALAWSVLALRARERGTPPPVLLSGPEQDAVLEEQLAGQAAGDGVPVAWPPGLPPEVLGLRAFRDELRDVYMRAAERGLVGADLATCGRAYRRPEWVAAGTLYDEYRDLLALRASGTAEGRVRLDPAMVVDEAAQALHGWEEALPGVPRPRWRLVVVDDYQEATAATVALLHELADDGARLVLLADPDVAVQTFRGADPSLVARAAASGSGLGEFAARPMVLGTVWRHGARLRAVVRRVTDRIGTAGTAAHRQASARADGPEGGGPREASRQGNGPYEDGSQEDGSQEDGSPAAEVALLAGTAQEAAFVARTLRTAHLDGVPWRDMAVIVRSGHRATSLRRALGTSGVPVSVGTSQVPLRDEPAVRPLLQVLALVTGERAELDPELAAELAQSPLGRLGPLALRRVRRELRRDELAAGGVRSSDALLVEALETPGMLVGMRSEGVGDLRRLARVIAAGREAAGRPGTDAHQVLWAVWEAAGLAEAWRAEALRGGETGARRDRDLDAVIVLFRVAETFVERVPEAGPRAFVDWIEAQDLPADTIAAHGQHESVPVLTAAGAAGREWRLVVVAGVQEGTWPDLRLRDSLLGAQALVDMLDGRAGPPPHGPGGRAAVEEARAARAAVLADELRGFAVACSRARSRLVVTAVDGADEAPSPFVDLVVPPSAAGDGPAAAQGDAPAAGDVVGDPRRVSVPVAPLDIRGLVATARAALERAAAAGVPDEAAARVLAHLARAGVPGADPDTWFGLAAPSSDTPLWPVDDKVPVSPSKVERVQHCALRWALETAGGTAATSAEQSLGSLIHDIARDFPTGSREQLAAALDERWAALARPPGWPATRERRAADAMIDRLAAYFAGAAAPLLVEAEFAFETDRARVSGRVDRVEEAPPGADGSPTVRIVDFKTGQQVTRAQAELNPQLATYQLAVAEDAFPDLPAGSVPAGAQLLYLDDGASGARRDQPALDDPASVEWARTLVDGVATAMAASTFVAMRNDTCRSCPVRSSCPVQAEGKQVTA